jgi:hypothetical protein
MRRSNFAAIGCWVLLFLVVCDWAGDPTFGHSVFAHPTGNEVVVPFAIVYREKIYQTIEASGPFVQSACDVSPGLAESSSELLPFLFTEDAAASLGHDTVYVFMSMQR